MDAEAVVDGLAAALLAFGASLMALGGVGVLRMPDVYTRAQAATKTSTLGLASTFLAVALAFGELATTSHALAVVAFAFLSVPVSAHMIARAAHASGVPPWPPGTRDDLRRDLAAEREDGGSGEGA